MFIGSSVFIATSLVLIFSVFDQFQSNLVFVLKERTKDTTFSNRS